MSAAKANAGGSLLTRCRGCKKPMESLGFGEAWHESCYQQHRADKPKCDAHAACQRANQAVKDRAREKE